MKIKFLRDCNYPQIEAAKSLVHKTGDVYEGDADYCQRWIRRGFAVAVVEERPKRSRVEAMVPAPPAKGESV